MVTATWKMEKWVCWQPLIHLNAILNLNESLWLFIYIVREAHILFIPLPECTHTYWGIFAIVGVCESVESSKLESNLKFKLFKAKFFHF